MDVFEFITVREYLLLEDTTAHDNLFTLLEPKKTIEIRGEFKYYIRKPRVTDLFKLEWKWVIKFRQIIKEPTLKTIQTLISVLYGTTSEQFYDLGIHDVMANYAWILSDLEKIYQFEKNNLHRKPTKKEEKAGIEMFDQIGDVVSIDKVAGGRIEMYDEVLEQPYGKVLRKLWLETLRNDYQENYSKLD